MSNINDLVRTESNVGPGKLPSLLLVLVLTQESGACVSPVKSRQGRSGQALALEQGGRGSSSLPFGGTK